jgi:hypothetical protein
MIVIEKKPELDLRSGCETEQLSVNRTDISFQDMDGKTVMIRVKIRNEGGRRSRPAIMRLESAALGAFAPRRPLAELIVPALEPGEQRELQTEASRFRSKTLGSFDRIPPGTLLSAVSAPSDEPAPQPAPGIAGLVALMQPRKAARAAIGGRTGKPDSLAPDLWDLLGREQPNWAGNIHVFVGKTAVERHFAKSLRIYAGRPNMAVFVVGGGMRDAYAFEMAGLAPGWQAGLHDMTKAKSLVIGPSDTPIFEKQWVECTGSMMMMLMVRPPIVCEDGNIEVQVTRRSSQQTAVVEFNLDPTAPGPGCYAS